MHVEVEQPCTQHPERLAGWACESCASNQCLECAATLQGVAVCGRCGLMVNVLEGPRWRLAPFSRTWRAQLRGLSSWQARVWMGLFTCAVQFLIAIHAAPKLWVLGHVLLVGWLLYATRRGGRELDPFGHPLWTDLFSIWTGPLVRAAPVLVPLGVFAAWWVDSGSAAAPLLSPLDWAVAALCCPLLAVALLTVTIEGEGRRWATPWALVRVGSVVRRELPTVLGLTALALGFALLSARVLPLDMEDTHMERTITLMFLLHLGMTMTLTALGIATGHLLVTYAEQLGHESGSAEHLPWVDSLPPTAWVAPKPDEDTLAAAAAERFKPIELESPREVLEKLIAARDFEPALAMVSRADVLLTEVEGGHLVTLAQAAAARGEPATAANLLEVLISRDEDEARPRGQVILARLLAERLSKPERAQRLYEEVVARFPGTPAAAFAREQLALSPTAGRGS